MKDECTEQQKEFVKQYVVDFKKQAAAIRAGYSEKTAHVQATDLLKKPKIRKEMNRLLDEIFKSVKQENQAQVLATIRKITHPDIRDIIVIKNK